MKLDFESIGAVDLERMMENPQAALDYEKEKISRFREMAEKIVRVFALTSALAVGIPAEAHAAHAKDTYPTKAYAAEAHKKFAFQNGEIEFQLNDNHDIIGFQVDSFESGIGTHDLEASFLNDNWQEHLKGGDSSIVHKSIDSHLRSLHVWKECYDQIISKKGTEDSEAVFLKKAMHGRIERLQNAYGSIFKADII